MHPLMTNGGVGLAGEVISVDNIASPQSKIRRLDSVAAGRRGQSESFGCVEAAGEQ
jgi:hypothetical protein